MAGFRHGEFPMEPGMAGERHISDLLEQTPIVPSSIASLPKRIAQKGLREEEKQLRERQGELSEMGEARAVACLEDALRELGNAHRSLETDERNER
jgi:hypothetical protein